MLQSSPTSRAGSKNDPQRKQRIIEATAEIIRMRGVEGVTFRRVAEAAGVPLGSTTYYFADKEALLIETIRELRAESDRQFRAILAAQRPVHGDAGAVAKLVEIVTTEWRKEFLAGYGVYLSNFTQENLRREIQDWHEESLLVMRDEFGPEPSLALSCLVEGLLLRSIISDVHYSAEEILPEFRRILDS